jgi:hypothetical protein
MWTSLKLVKASFKSFTFNYLFKYLLSQGEFKAYFALNLYSGFFVIRELIKLFASVEIFSHISFSKENLPLQIKSIV